MQLVECFYVRQQNNGGRATKELCLYRTQCKMDGTLTNCYPNWLMTETKYPKSAASGTHGCEHLPAGFEQLGSGTEKKGGGDVKLETLAQQIPGSVK